MGFFFHDEYQDKKYFPTTAHTAGVSKGKEIKVGETSDDEREMTQPDRLGMSEALNRAKQLYTRSHGPQSSLVE